MHAYAPAQSSYSTTPLSNLGTKIKSEPQPTLILDYNLDPNLDLTRVQMIDLQEGTKPYCTGDAAEKPLFKV